MVYMWSIFDLCVLCGSRTAGTGLCRNCMQQLPRNPVHCRRCALPLATPGQLCADCQRHPPPFEKAHAPFLYRWPVDELVTTFKHGLRLYAGRILADMVLDALPSPPPTDLIVPVPLHPERLAERGFNQAGELATYLSGATGRPVDIGLLRRVHDGVHQQGSGRGQRVRNVKGVFRVTGRHLPRRVLLVDDVMTTGATLREASRALRTAGIGEVHVLAVARVADSAAAHRDRTQPAAEC